MISLLGTSVCSIQANEEDQPNTVYTYEESGSDTQDWEVHTLDESAPVEVFNIPGVDVFEEGVSVYANSSVTNLEPLEDTRKQITDTSKYPYRAIVYLLMLFPDGTSLRGTGIMIAEDTVLTAAHCTYDSRYGGWAKTIAVTPNSNGSLDRNSQISGVKAIATKEFLQANNSDVDYAIVKLNKPMGFKTGSLTFASNFSVGQNIRIPGYPSSVNGAYTTKMWESNGSIYSVDNQLMSFRSYISGGQSGSPVVDSNNRIISLAVSRNVGKTLAFGPVFDQYNKIKIETWMNDTISVYRIINPNTNEQLYTKSGDEIYTLESRGWKNTKLAWFGHNGGYPVYRLLNPNTKDHHYTRDYSERDALVNAGWIDEGIGWRSYGYGDNPVYRLYNRNVTVGSHIYTASVSEKNDLIGKGWVYEGIAWYGGNSDHEAQ